MYMRKTKIVCTLGPACLKEEILTEMLKNGMNVARFNFSHGTHEDHRRRMELIKGVRKKLSLPIALLLDTKGPEYRIKTFAEGKIQLEVGDAFTFTTEDVVGDQHRVSVTYPNLPQEMSVGDTILLNNGLLEFEVTAIEGTCIHTRVVDGGELSDRKSMCFPGKVLKQTYLSEQDKADILFGIENDVDFIAASFVRTAEDVRLIKAELNRHGCSDIRIISKIENREGIENADEILKESDGLMVFELSHIINNKSWSKIKAGVEKAEKELGIRK